MKIEVHLFSKSLILIALIFERAVTGLPTNSTDLDPEDFLNVFFLPSTLVLESDLLGDSSILVDNNTLNKNANVDTALQTMSYHRTMINKYLCRNYIAKEILEEVDRSDIKSDRLGIAAGSKISPKRKFLKDSPIDQNELLDDEGSDNYKKWLAKSSIFEDIYNHYNSKEDKDEDQSTSASSNVQLYESGDITGFAVQQSDIDTKEKQASQLYDQYLPPWAPPGNIPVPSIHTHHHHKYNYNNDHQMSGVGLPPVDYGGHSSFDTFGGAGHGYGHHLHEDHSHGHDHGHEEKGLALKDLFDLALTALAFLAFGMFILNLILTCFTAQAPTVVMQMGDGDGNDSLKRVRRDSPMNLEYLNELSYRVVNSIDALASIQKSADEDHCLQLSLCQNNKFARELSKEQQIWVPAWSFGLSWISGKIRGKSESMLEYLRAIIVGMGKAKCERLYPKCNRPM